MDPETPTPTTSTTTLSTISTTIPSTTSSSISKKRFFKFVAANGFAFFFLLLSIPLGLIDVIVFISTNHLREVSIDYTNCMKPGNTVNINCAELVTSPLNDSCYCEVIFNLAEKIPAPVYMYYALTNFHQNHRAYVLSKDFNQLQGKLSPHVDFECEPYHEVIENGTKKTIAPCGAIANSMFFDGITLYSENKTVDVPLLKTKIAWPNLKKKFNNPPGNLTEAFANYAKPITWKKQVWELDPENPTNNGFLNEDFIVWMQPAASPNFRKLYRRIDHSKRPFIKGLRPGKYKLKIDYAFPVIAFKGTKSIVLSNSSFFGGKNCFLIPLIMVLTIMCTLVTFILLSIRVFKIRLTRNSKAKSISLHSLNENVIKYNRY